MSGLIQERRASSIQRLAASFLDLLLITLVYLLLYWILNQILNTFKVKGIIFDISQIITVYILFFYGYHFLFDASNFQGTVGKRLLGLRVINAQAGKLTVPQSLFRNLLRLASILPLGAGLWVQFFRKDNLSFHDWLSKTQVVTIRPKRSKQSSSTRFSSAQISTLQKSEGSEIKSSFFSGIEPHKEGDLYFQKNEDFESFNPNEGIVADNLVKIYKKRPVVNGVTFHVRQGEVVGLLGPNGAGKTTTFYMIVGLVKPNKGRILLDGKNIARYPMFKRARMGIGYLPQEMSIFRKLSVEDNIRAVLDIQGKPKEEIEETVESLLDELGLKKIRRQLGYTLSGGEKRRTEVARILSIKPRFLLLDEPFTGIDPIAIADIQKIIIQLKETRNLGILITDHNVRETLKITDRAYIKHEGRILVSGTRDELVTNEDAKRIYLGRDFTM